MVITKPLPNNGFNRTPASSGPAKPASSGAATVNANVGRLKTRVTGVRGGLGMSWAVGGPVSQDEGAGRPLRAANRLPQCP